MTHVLGLGDRAPDFALPDQYGKPVTFESLRDGRGVLLVFFPFAFTGICTGELHEIRDDLARFQNEHVQTVAISCDSLFSLRAWDDQHGYFFPLLSDFWPHGQAAQSYGVFSERVGCAVRGTFFCDPDGIIRWRLVHAPGERRDFSGFHATLAKIIGA